MKTITKQYIELIPNENHTETHLLVELNYDKGDSNLFGYKRKRGYHLYVYPIELFYPEGCQTALIKTELGKGLSMPLLEVSRQSKSAENKAIALAAEQKAMLIQKVCKRYGLTLMPVPAETEVD